MNISIYVPDDIRRLKEKLSSHSYYSIVLDALAVANLVALEEQGQVGIQCPDGTFKVITKGEARKVVSRWKRESRKAFFKSLILKCKII